MNQSTKKGKKLEVNTKALQYYHKPNTNIFPDNIQNKKVRVSHTSYLIKPP